MSRVVLILLCVASIVEAQTSQPATSVERGFLVREIVHAEQTHKYAVFVPPSYDESRAWPVILFLHGSGERGTDGFRQTGTGIGRAIRRNVDRIPAIVVMPQCAPSEMWRGPMVDLAVACLDETLRTYKTDPRRVYITGLSMGGAGTWETARKLRGRVAAIAPICGFVGMWRDIPTEEEVGGYADELKDVPTWIFHGALDRAVTVEQSRVMAAALKERGAMMTYTEYPEGKHNIWDRVYEQREFWGWLFSHKLPAPDEG